MAKCKASFQLTSLVFNKESDESAQSYFFSNKLQLKQEYKVKAKLFWFKEWVIACYANKICYLNLPNFSATWYKYIMQLLIDY